MTIALPPPQTPSMGDLDHLRSETASGFEFDFVNYHVHVTGNDRLSNRDVERAFDNATTLSAGVQNISKLYYRAGYPVTRVVYALSGLDLYVHIAVKGVDRVKASGSLGSYFQGLAGDKPLVDTQLERHRLLADVAAKRAGISGRLVIRKDQDAAQPQYVLHSTTSGDPHIGVHGSFDFSNIGNRYVGKYIMNGGVQLTAPFGGKLNLGVVSNVPGTAHGTFYRGYTGNYNQVTPYGIFGVDGRYVTLHRSVSGLHLREKIRTGGVSWLYPLYVSFRRRLWFTAHLTRHSLAVRLAEFPRQDAKSELYTALGLELRYMQRFGAGGDWTLTGGLQAERGFGPAHTALTYAQLDYLLLRPLISLSYAINPSWTLALDMRGQFTSNTLPETKQWVLGGLGQLAAYRAGVLIGDTGSLASLKLSYETRPWWLITLTPAVFVEYGYSRQTHALGSAPRQSTQQLADAGASIIVKLGDHLSGGVVVSHGFFDNNLNPQLRHQHRASYLFRVNASF